MEKVCTAAEMQAIDRTAIETFGIPGIVLMENAGRSICEVLGEKFPQLGEYKVTIVCGKGNNGGDGFVVARHLHNQGVRVQIYLIGNLTQLKNDALTNARIAQAMELSIREIGESPGKSFAHDLRHSDLIVDAIFGTGLQRAVEGVYAEVIERINQAGTPVVAVDVPSGIDSDSAVSIGPHINAQLTIALGLRKRCHLLYPIAEAMGETQWVDISLPQKVIEESPISVHLAGEEDVSRILRKRKPNTHKGDYGHVLVIGGSPGKEGAIGLTGLAALRSGAGLVTQAVSETCHASLQHRALEVMSVSLPETGSGALSADAVDLALQHCGDKTAVALGPGLGTDPETIEFIRQLIPKLAVPWVLDADGLNCLSHFPEILLTAVSPGILTPHPKEMSRLCGKPVQEILSVPIETATEFSTRYNVAVLLKGARSLIAFPDGSVALNCSGNPGMATGGSGDVLTGIIAGLLGQDLPLQDASITGMVLHGLAGDLYAEANSEISLIAGDLLRTLPECLKRLLP